jgi:hypothetical protein
MTLKMAINQNTAIEKNLSDRFKIQRLTGEIPKQINNSIVPIVDVDKKYSNITAYNAATGAGTTTIYTTSGTKDFYLTGLTLSMVDGSAALIQVKAYVGGKLCILFTSRIAHTGNLMFTYPLKLDRNTTITMVNTGGTYEHYCTIYGIEEEVQG